jgi:tuberous sclerosis 1
MSAYDNLFYDAFLSDDLKRKQTNGVTVTTTLTTTTTITDHSQVYHKPHNLTTSEMLDQYIQASLRKMKSNDYKDHLELLAIQLQFEKYRREIHAERNRRLLGKSRQIRGLEQSNETMSDQVARLSTEITNLNKKAAETRNEHQMQLQKSQNDIKMLSKKCNEEMEKNRQLQREKDLLQKKFDEEHQMCRTYSQINDDMSARIFDLNNLLAAAQEEAQRGKEYRQQLVKLQAEMIIFNDARVKCKQQMEELNSLKARDEEAEGMYKRYSYEIADTRKKLEMKTSQNDSYRSKICDLEQQLSKKESSIREHKILNMTMIRAYDEKFKVNQSLNFNSFDAY